MATTTIAIIDSPTRGRVNKDGTLVIVSPAEALAAFPPWIQTVDLSKTTIRNGETGKLAGATLLSSEWYIYQVRDGEDIIRVRGVYRSKDGAIGGWMARIYPPNGAGLTPLLYTADPTPENINSEFYLSWSTVVVPTGTTPTVFTGYDIPIEERYTTVVSTGTGPAGGAETSTVGTLDQPQLNFPEGYGEETPLTILPPPPSEAVPYDVTQVSGQLPAAPSSKVGSGPETLRTTVGEPTSSNDGGALLSSAAFTGELDTPVGKVPVWAALALVAIAVYVIWKRGR